MSQFENSVHISNLPFTESEKEVLAFLQEQPNSSGIKMVDMPHHRQTHNNRGYCNVELPTAEQAASFIASINDDVKFKGRPLHAEQMKEKEENSRTSAPSGPRNNTRGRQRRRPYTFKDRTYSAHFSGFEYDILKEDMEDYLKDGGKETEGFDVWRFPMQAPRKNKGFCDVSFPTEEQLDQVIAHLDGCEMFNYRRVKVTKTQPLQTMRRPHRYPRSESSAQEAAPSSETPEQSSSATDNNQSSTEQNNSNVESKDSSVENDTPTA